MDVKQNATPARHEEATVPKTPASGKESRAPMVTGEEDSERKMVVEAQVVTALVSTLRHISAHVSARPAADLQVDVHRRDKCM